MRGFSMLRGAEVTWSGRITEEERKKITLENNIIHKIRTTPPKKILKMILILILIFLEMFYEKSVHVLLLEF